MFKMQWKSKYERQEKLRRVFYEYYTNYLLFSNEYKRLGESGELDGIIKQNYLYFLFNQIEDMKEDNIYPSFIISRAYDLLSVLKERLQYCYNETEIVSMNALMKQMEENLNQIEFPDQTEIWYREYNQRYSSIKNIHTPTCVSLDQLYVDIQEDFLYFARLFYTASDADFEIDPQKFYRFLQKLMIDYPEVKEDKVLSLNIKNILSKFEDEEAKKWIHFLKDPYTYPISFGFNIEQFEILHSTTLLKKFLFSYHIQDDLKETNLNHLYYHSFLLALRLQLLRFLKSNITLKEKENMKEVISFMRFNLPSDHVGKEEIVSILNDWIQYFNTREVNEEMEELPYSKEYPKRFKHPMKWVLARDEESKYMKAQIDVSVTLDYDIMKYFLTTEEKREETRKILLEEGEILVNSIRSLFWEYPRMFFDDVIYERTMDLLEEFNTKDAKEMKKKIGRIHKR